METISILINLIPKEHKRKIIIFIVFTLITTLLEGLSIGLIFPLIIFLLDKENSNLFDNKFLDINNLNFENENIVYLLLFSLVFIYLIKSMFLIFFQWWKNSFANYFQLFISKKILKNYLHMSYLRSININSSIKLRNIMTEAPKIRKSFISVMKIFVEISIILILIAIISFVQPLSALIALTFCLLIFFLYNYFFKKILQNWGKQRLILSGKVIKTLKDSFGATNEIKSFYKEDYFLDKFYDNEKNLLKYIKYFATFNISPRVILEFFTVFLIVISIIVMINLDYSNAKILAIITVLGAAGLRILPSSASLIASFNELKNNKLAINVISDLLNNETVDTKKATQLWDLKDSIELKHLNFAHNSKKILNEINFKIKKNEFIGIDGKSGSGKTTLINIILGFIKPDSGKILYDNVDIHQFKKNYKIGYVPQKSFLLDDSILNNITFGEPIHDNLFFEEILQICCLDDFVNKSVDKLNTIIGENALQISGGQRQRIAIARALFLKPDIIVLDESFNEIDETTSLKILENILKYFKNKIIILVSHNNIILNRSDSIFKVENGIINKIK